MGNIKNNQNGICAGHNIENYGRSSSSCTGEMKWKITLNNNTKTLFMCNFCKERGLYALDNKFDCWESATLV